jgi:hemoglobin
MDPANADKPDLETRADCEVLVRRFYSRALADPLIGWIFVDVAKLDLETHIPKVASFWETVLLGSRSYGGGAFAPHAAVHDRARLRKAHFDRWLMLWTEAVDDLFAGPTADQAKAHAQRVARAFRDRLAGRPDATDVSSLPLRLAITRVHPSELT